MVGHVTGQSEGRRATKHRLAVGFHVALAGRERRRRFEGGTTPLRQKRDVVHERGESPTPMVRADSTKLLMEVGDHEGVGRAALRCSNEPGARTRTGSNE